MLLTYSTHFDQITFGQHALDQINFGRSQLQRKFEVMLCLTGEARETTLKTNYPALCSESTNKNV